MAGVSGIKITDRGILTNMKSFFGSFFGRIVGSLFIAICALLGFGPNEWAEYIIVGLPVWVTPTIAQYAFIALGVLVLASLIWKYPIIIWNWVKNTFHNAFCKIEWVDGTHSIHSFSYVISRPHNQALVQGIRLKGRNKRNKPLMLNNFYLRSLVTGEELKGEVNNLKAEEVEIIGNGIFSLTFRFPNEDGKLANNSISGITFQRFLKRYGQFEIVVAVDSRPHRFVYDENKTKEWVTSVHMGLMMPSAGKKATALPSR